MFSHIYLPCRNPEYCVLRVLQQHWWGCIAETCSMTLAVGSLRSASKIKHAAQVSFVGSCRDSFRPFVTNCQRPASTIVQHRNCMHEREWTVDFAYRIIKFKLICEISHHRISSIVRESKDGTRRIPTKSTRSLIPIRLSLQTLSGQMKVLCLHGRGSNNEASKNIHLSV